MFFKKLKSQGSKTPQWRFREMQRGEINVDPIEGEFFNTEAISSISDALVREAIQNSLDASVGKGPVTVRFSFMSGTDAGSEKIKDLYLSGLGTHLEARHSGLQNLPSPAERPGAVLIEDFGTRGLQGDIYQFGDLNENGTRNDFYYFWRNIGRTRKERTDLGRWGLGKTVFQAASRINTFFGLTVREDEGRSLLMGQCVLRIHQVNGTRYAPYGYFGLVEDGLALPIEEATFIREFSQNSDIRRGKQPGLSILIPYPDGEIKLQTCLDSVIKHHFFPLLSGDLVVEVRVSGKGIRLDASTLERIATAERYKKQKELSGLLALARWAIHQTEGSFIRLSEPEQGRAPKLREELFTEAQLEKARHDLNENKRLAFYLPLTIQRQDGNTFIPSGFSLFLEKDPQLDRPEDHFTRQGITIPEVTSLKQKGIRALVSIIEPDLATFLGDAENPAHTDWERNSKKFKTKYKLGPSTLDFIKSSPREIVKILTRPQKGRDEHLLRHLFSLPGKTLRGKEETQKDTAEGEDTKHLPSSGFEAGNAAYLQLHRVKGGFRLSRHAKACSLPRHISVWAAYEVRNGNPFKKYTPLDFDLEKPPMKVIAQGADTLVAQKNALQIEIKDPNFRLQVTGFDINRDLRIKTHP